MNERCRHFIPGPSWVRPEILAALGGPVIGHRTEEFRELYARILSNLRRLFMTSQHVFTATTSGTGIMEAALLNCVPRSVLVTTCGAFSERWLEIAGRLGLEVDHYSVAWGRGIDPDELATFIEGRHHHYDAVTITHNETSTGVMNDLPALVEAVRQASPEALILVDAVSSLACAPIPFDELDLDVCLASVQKGLALPAGMTVFAVSERAMERVEKHPFRGLYFDFEVFRDQAATHSAPFTPSLPHLYALDRQLGYILDEETLDKRFERHRTMQTLTSERTMSYLELATEPTTASPSVSAFRSRGSRAPDVVRGMRERGYALGGGYGAWKESTLRIGHMGDVTIEDLEAMLEVLEETVSQSTL